MIPKVFHNIWIGGKLPDKHKWLIDRMLALHPDWGYKLWNESNMPKLTNQDIYDKFDSNCYKADIARYEIVLKNGGLYIDTDFLFLKNIDKLIVDNFFVTREFPATNKESLNNCILGATANHEALMYVVMKLREVYYTQYDTLCREKGKDLAGLRTVGPRFLSNALSSFAPELERRALDMKYFSPFNKRTQSELYRKYPEAYAIHLWNHKGFDNVDIDRIIKIQES